MLGYAYVRTNNLPDAAKAWEAELDDGFTTAPEQQQKVRSLAELHYQLKNYDKAIDYGQRAIKGGYGDEELKKLVGQAYYLKGDWKGTLKFEEALVDATIKGGSTPSNESLQLILSSCVKIEDSACTTKALERLVTYYPKPDYWYNLLFGISKEASNSDPNTLQVYRLMFDVDVLKSPEDYTEMAQLALESGSPGEAQRVLQRGFDKNVFADQRAKEKNQRLLDKAKQAAASDQATLDKTAKEADASPTGAKNAGMGLAYLGYAQYDKAVDELTKAVSKGSLRNPPETQLLLGIAQLKAGHKDEAVKAFKAVKGDPILERLSALWILHARQ
jgi:tetratricopeptide (TPR) repeat protein